MITDQPCITTRQGAVRGLIEDGAAAFRAIPYAASPAGELRFRPPAVHVGWDGIRDAASAGPAVPQRASRLESVMGPARVVIDEDESLNLNVWTPQDALTDGRRRPVLVWIHGGGWTSGSGGWDWYDGARLAGDNDIVVVTINYRLGSLGFLWLPEIGAANLGLQDQGAALRWVRENIDAFGGDAGDVTVGGQSAGAYSALSLALDPATRPMIRKVIAQSGPWAVTGQSPAAATLAADEFLELLGLTRGDGLLGALQGVPAANLLEAYYQLPRHALRPTDVAPGMYPVLGGPGLPDRWTTAVARGGLRDVPLLIGSTEHEMSAFVPAITRPEQADDATAIEFGDGVARIAETLAAQGRPAHVYRFARRSTTVPKLGATHCAELPFVFNRLDAYAGAPMLGDVDDPDVKLADTISSSIGQFVRTGFANGSGWAPYDPSDGSYTEIWTH